MSEQADAQEGQLDQADFKKKMLSQLQTTGVIGQVKSQLRAQLLSQLQKGQIVQLGPPPGDRPGLKRHALNSMIADYLGKVQYNYSLSVFKEESGVESRPLLTEDELLDVLKVDRETSFFQSYMKSKAHGGSDSCFILNLLSAISEAAAAKGKESFTQTIGGDRYQMEVRMKQLEDEYQSRLRAARMAPGAGLEERLALYRQEIEEQAAAEVARQVERIREMEVAAARLDEASKARRAMEAERLELDRMHSERLTKLRQREEEMMDKLRRQQRDVENVAYEHRQRILREEERMRNHKTEIQQQHDSRLEQLRQLERSLELRERAVAAREAAAEKKLAEATEAAAEAQVEARQDVEREFMELKNNLAQQRMQIEMDRSRIMELRSEATAEIAGARAKEERLRALETARAEAEARAAAHAADAEVCRLQAEKLAMELNEAREELSRRLAQAADGADAMLANAAGAMNMLNAEAMASRSAGSQIREAMAQLERAREEANNASAAVAQLQQECASLHAALSASGAEAESLRAQLARVEALLDEAVAARSEALSAVEESQFRMFQLERELADLRSALAKSKEEAAALRMQTTAQRRPPSRGADSPNRRSITLSPSRRPAPGATSAAISALSLGLALGGGPGGVLAGAAGGHTPVGWQWQHSGGGGSSGVAGGTPTLSQMEFPIAAAPRDPTLERLERLRRQEEIVAGQEDMYRKRMVAMQEVRDRSLAATGQAGGSGGGGGAYGRPSQQQLYYQYQQQQQQYHAESSSPSQAPYMTYVMHGSPVYQQPQGPVAAAPAPAAEATYQPPQLQHQRSMSVHSHRQRQQQHQQHYHQAQQEPPYPQQQQQQQQQQQHHHHHHSFEPQHEHVHHEHQHLNLRDHDDQAQYAHEPQQGQHQQPAPQQHHHRDQHSSQHHHSHSQATQLHSDAPPSLHSSYHTQLRQQHHSVDSAGSLPPPGAPFAPAPATSTAPAFSLSPPTNEVAASSHGSPPPRVQRSFRDADNAQHAGLAGDAVLPPNEPSYTDRTGGGGGGLQSARSGAYSGEVPLRHMSLLSASEPLQEAAPMEPVAAAPAVVHPPAAIQTFPLYEANEPPTPPAPAAPAPVLPPPGLVITSNFGPPLVAPPPPPPPEPPTSFQPPPPPVEEAPPPSPPKPTIPGLVIVSGFSARGPAQQQQPPPPERQAEKPPSPPESVHDVQSMLQAKMRMLQEQRERALAAQQQQQQPVRRTTSQSSRVSDGSASGGATAAQALSTGLGRAEREDSSSALIATEALDTVAPELSTMQRRPGGGRRTSHEGSGHLSRQSSSIHRRDLPRGTSFARSEASAYSVEAPGAGLAGNSARALSVNMTIDDIPSSMDGYELPGLHDDDDDDGVEAPNDDGRYGAFAAEFSAGSVF